MTPEETFDKLSPFEKTVLLQSVQTQAFASSAFQVAFAKEGEAIPPASEILAKAQAAALQGMLQTLKKNQ